MASLAAWVLCIFVLVGCGDEEPPAPPEHGSARDVVISGEVHDAAGQPVGGAMIFLAQEAQTATSPSPTSTEPLEMRRTLVGATNASGRYAVSLAGGEDRDRAVWMTASHPDFAFSADTERPLLVEAGVSALPGPTLRVLRAGALIGRVEDENGQGLPDVEVLLRSPHVRAEFHTRSGIDGVFRYPAVPEGPVGLRLATQSQDEVGIDVLAAGEVNVPDGLVADPAKGDG